MSNDSPAAKFIEDSINHSEWLKIIEAGPADAVVKLAGDNGYACTLNDLKEAARNLLAGSQKEGAEAQPSEAEVDEAASGMSDLESDTGYGDDTGYAALYGVAGVILKM